MKKYLAELFGTFWLVFGGCGSAIFAAAYPDLGIGFLGVAFAFGLTVLTMAYAVGHISGGHFNPAVTIGVWVANRFPFKDVIPYIVSQIVGAILASGVLYLILTGRSDFSQTGLGGFASNGYGDLSPGGYNLISAFIAEFVLTMFFLIVILGSTRAKAPVGFAPISIGLALVLIHLISIPITNTSVNPARSLAPAIFAGGEHLSQVWLFFLAPILGALLAGGISRLLFKERTEDIEGYNK